MDTMGPLHLNSQVVQKHVAGGHSTTNKRSVSIWETQPEAIEAESSWPRFISTTREGGWEAKWSVRYAELKDWVGYWEKKVTPIIHVLVLDCYELHAASYGYRMEI